MKWAFGPKVKNIVAELLQEHDANDQKERCQVSKVQEGVLSDYGLSNF